MVRKSLYAKGAQDDATHPETHRQQSKPVDESDAAITPTDNKTEDVSIDGAPSSSKKRKVAAGGRGVANLTPDQLAKKRANGEWFYRHVIAAGTSSRHFMIVILFSNFYFILKKKDREAQRAIRERTKTQIQTLERRIKELTSMEPIQELQAALDAKKEVERENAEIRKQLASIVAILQPMIGTTHIVSVFQGCLLLTNYRRAIARQFRCFGRARASECQNANRSRARQKDTVATTPSN